MKTLLFFALLLVSTFATAKDLYIHNVVGYTLDANGSMLNFDSMLVEEGKVSALNPKEQSLPKGIKRLDGNNRVLLPGIIDAHGHLLGLGAELRQINLRGTTSEAEAVGKVKAALSNNLGSEWLVGRGWNQVLWSSKNFPTAASLDDVVSDRPVYLERIDGHAGWANSKAMAMAGITDQTPDPDGGKIIRDKNGKATGVLIDTAMSFVEKILPPTSTELMQYELSLAGEHLLSLGITGMHDAGISKQVYDFYLIQGLQNKLPVRIYAMVAATDPNLDIMLANGPVTSATDMLHIRSVKVYGDGALGSRGAAMLKPYTDKSNEVGLVLTSEDKIMPLFEKIAAANFQINYHAIGDKANNMALDAFAKLFKTTESQALRNRVEHAQVIALSDISRFADLKVIPSMQPTHATSDMNMAEYRIGSQRIKGAYAFRTLWESGARVPLGSDFPVELANPFHGFHAAVTRQNRDNQPEGGWYPNEALTIEQTFDGFTRTAAYAGHMENKVGTLVPGHWADFILVDQDIFKIDAQDLWKTQVQSTWIAGEKRFDINKN